jgi:hypothetical protein
MGYEVRTTRLYGFYVGQQDDFPTWFMTWVKEKWKAEWSVNEGYMRQDIIDAPDAKDEIETEYFREFLSGTYLHGWPVTDDEEGPVLVSFGRSGSAEYVIGVKIDTHYVKPGRGPGGLLSKNDDIKAKKKAVDTFLATLNTKGGPITIQYEC